MPDPTAEPDAERRPIISMRNIQKRFGSEVVLDDIDLDVYPGETMVIIGGSGSGKTTILRLMIGSLSADRGEIHLFGQDLSRIDEDGMNEVRKRFGILFQSGALYNSMTLADNVALALHEHTDLDREIIDIQVKIKLELVGLREHADKLPGQISGGMKKRAGLARALALDPQILFYDEPSAGLDPVTSAQIDQLILGLTRKLGVTSVVVTHEMDSAFTVSDRMAMLDKGRMLKIESREWFKQLRDLPSDQADDRDEDQRLIRQFLRGDADGPLTERRSTEDFRRDLFGTDLTITPTPSVEPTRRA